MPIGELFVREKVPGLLPIKRNQQNLPVGGFAARSPQSLSIQIKFWSSFFKSLWFPKAAPAGRPPQRAKYPYRSKRQVALKLSAELYFCLARHEIEQSSISLVCAGLLQEKSPLKKLPIKKNQQNLPVGGFAVTRTEARGQEGAQRFSCFLRGGWLELECRFADERLGG